MAAHQGSPVPGILQARTLEGVAISFSNAWKVKVKVKSLSQVQLLATPWAAAHQAPPSIGFSRQEYWSGVPLPSPRLQSMGSQRVRHDWETSLSLPFTFTICSWECKGYDYCSSINIFSKNQILTSGTYKSYYIWKKGICRCDEVKDFEWTDFWLSRP